MKQKNKIQLLLVAAFAGLSVMCYAQGKVCTGKTYDIVSLQDPSDASQYQWTLDGQNIPGATAAAYTVPDDKPAGKYTYIRRSMKAGCDWASSNAYTVEVLSCNTNPQDEGDKGIVTDSRDGKIYKIVKMPDGKVWMAENLNYQGELTFNQQSDQANGKLYKDYTNGVPAIGSFWCPPPSSTATASADKNTCNVYGALYTWETAMTTNGGESDKGGALWKEPDIKYYEEAATKPKTDDIKVVGICMEGYHLPTDYEWAALLDAVDPTFSGKYIDQDNAGWYGTDANAEAVNPGAGVKMKSASTYLGGDPGNGAWQDSEKRGNDASGFGAVPAGYRSSDGARFANRGTNVYYWSSSVVSGTNAWSRNFNSGYAQVSRGNNARSYGFSVRCVRDN
jgi:uncharacterized protein (TIGR02145 family)